MPGNHPCFHYTPPSSQELANFPAKAIRKVAINIARRHWALMSGASEEVKLAHSLATHEYGVSAATIKGSTPSGRIKRLSTEKFWLNKLNQILDLSREEKARCAGLLGSKEHGKMAYCSDATIAILKAREEQIIKSLRNSPRKNIAAIYAHSAKSTFNKMYLQAKAMDVVAKKRGMAWVFVTLTCPPEYHANSDLFDGSCFNDGQAYLNKVYAQVGREISNRGYKSGRDFFGIRVVELHKDGTPHWHVLYYYTGDLNKVIEQKLAKVYAKETSRPANYIRNKSNKIFIYKQPEICDSDAQGTTAALSYMFKKLSYGLQLFGHSRNEDAIRHRYAIKASGARQIQTFGVKGHSTKINSLRKAYGNVELPEDLKVLAEPLKMDKGIIGRNEIQLRAMVDVFEGSLDHLQLLSTHTLNRYGERVHRVTHIKSDQSQEVICIKGSLAVSSQYHRGSVGGVNINDSSILGDVSTPCAENSKKNGTASQYQITTMTKNRYVEEPGYIDPTVPIHPLSDNDGILVASLPYSHRPWRARLATRLLLLKAKLQGLVDLHQCTGHIRLRFPGALSLVLCLILLAHGMLAKSYQARSCELSLPSPHYPGTRLKRRTHLEPMPSYRSRQGGARDPPSFAFLLDSNNYSWLQPRLRGHILWRDKTSCPNILSLERTLTKLGF